MEIKVRTDDLVSVAQAAKALGKPRLTIYRWIDAGKIVGIKTRRYFIYSKDRNRKVERNRKSYPG
jgi:excisionase family DNA binding protein